MAPAQRSTPAGVVGRCAVHPARPAVDACPRCGRPRCGADALDDPAGCRACSGAPLTSVRRPPGRVERLVRAALAASATALLGGVVASEYVGASVFDVLVPLLVGVACGAAAGAAAGPAPAGRRDLAVLAVATGYALVGAGYGFRFVVGGEDPFGPAGGVLGPYLAAAAGPWLWRFSAGGAGAGSRGHPAGRRGRPAGRDGSAGGRSGDGGQRGNEAK